MMQKAKLADDAINDPVSFMILAVEEKVAFQNQIRNLASPSHVHRVNLISRVSKKKVLVAYSVPVLCSPD